MQLQINGPGISSMIRHLFSKSASYQACVEAGRFALRPLARSSLGTAVAPAIDRAPVFIGYRGVSPGLGRVGSSRLPLRRASNSRHDRSLSLRLRSLGRFRALRFAKPGCKSLANIRCAHVGNFSANRCAADRKVRLCI